MEQNEPQTPTDVIAKRVREVRKRRGWTAEQLADRLTEQGIPWQRSTVAKLENGNRENVTVAEWLALATVLNVAPVHLLLPTNRECDEDPYVITPQKTEPVKDVRAWVRGNLSLGNGPHKEFVAEAPEGEWVSFDTTTPEGQQAAWKYFQRLEAQGFPIKVNPGAAASRDEPKGGEDG